MMRNTVHAEGRRERVEDGTGRHQMNRLRDNSIVLGEIQSRCLGSVGEWLIGKSNSNPSQITL